MISWWPGCTQSNDESQYSHCGGQLTGTVALVDDADLFPAIIPPALAEDGTKDYDGKHLQTMISSHKALSWRRNLRLMSASEWLSVSWRRQWWCPWVRGQKSEEIDNYLWCQLFVWAECREAKWAEKLVVSVAGTEGCCCLDLISSWSDWEGSWAKRMTTT